MHDGANAIGWALVRWRFKYNKKNKEEIVTTIFYILTCVHCLISANSTILYILTCVNCLISADFSILQ